MTSGTGSAAAVAVARQISGAQCHRAAASGRSIAVASSCADDGPVFQLRPCRSEKKRSRADGTCTFPDKANRRGGIFKKQSFYDSSRHLSHPLPYKFADVWIHDAERRSASGVPDRDAVRVGSGGTKAHGYRGEKKIVAG